MIASRLIKEDILALNIHDTVDEAISRMIEYKVSNFPVTDEGQFVGMVTEKEIFELDDTDAVLQKEFFHFENYHVNENQYIFDILKMASNQKLSIIPVVDEVGNYMGSITQEDIIAFFAKSMSVDFPGGVVILEVSQNDYSLTEIANIVEKLFLDKKLTAKQTKLLETIFFKEIVPLKVCSVRFFKSYSAAKSASGSLMFDVTLS